MDRSRWLAVVAVVGAVAVVIGASIFTLRKVEPSSKRGDAVTAPVASQPIPPTAGEPAQAQQQRVPVNTLLANAETARAAGAYREAQQLYQQVIQSNPNTQAAATAQQRLGEVSVQLLLSPAAPSSEENYTVQPGDTLSKIAQEGGVTIDLLRSANGLQGDLIRVGQTLRVPKVQFSVIVDKSQNTLTLKSAEDVLKVYRCSTGQGGVTPTGQFKIVTRLVNPVWKGVVAAEDPENPLGTRWLGFDLPEYGIHGTNEPETVGQPVTKGCIRLLNSDVEELFTLLPEGTPVTIVE